MFWVQAHGIKAGLILNLLFLIHAVPYECISWQWVQSIMIWFYWGISGITWSLTIHGLWRRPEVVDCPSLSKVHRSAYEYKGWRSFGSNSLLCLVSQWPLCTHTSHVIGLWFILALSALELSLCLNPMLQTSQDFAVLGASSKLFAVFLTYPYQVCTGTLLQIEFHNLLKTFSMIIGSKHDAMTQFGLSLVSNLTTQNGWVVCLSSHDQWCLQIYSYNKIFMKCPRYAVLCDCVYIYIVWSILQVIRSRLQVPFVSWLIVIIVGGWGIQRHWQQFMSQLTEIVQQSSSLMINP